MNLSAVRPFVSSLPLRKLPLRRGLAFGLIILSALLAFELFNYSTTEFALADFLGNLQFGGLRWSTILAIAFCGMDFAGIARLFTPGDNSQTSNEVWYLFGAWLLAATMNAMLTWWGVSIAILNHVSSGSAVIGRETLLHVVPVFVAILVWLIRVLIIGTFSVSGAHLFAQGEPSEPRRRHSPIPVSVPVNDNHQAIPLPTGLRPLTRPATQAQAKTTRPEPTYQPVSMSASHERNFQNPIARH